MYPSTRAHVSQSRGTLQKDAIVRERHQIGYTATQQQPRSRNVMLDVRPKTSGGYPSRQGLAELPPLVTHAPRLDQGGAFQETRETIDFRAGLETFKFPTPSPLLPPRSATFPEILSPKQNGNSGIGLAIGSPSELMPSKPLDEALDLHTVRRPPRMSSLYPPNALHSIPRSRFDNEAPPKDSERRSGWKAFGGMFRKPAKPMVPHCEESAHQQYMRKDSAMATASSPEQCDGQADYTTALPQLPPRPPPQRQFRTRGQSVMYGRAESEPRNRKFSAPATVGHLPPRQSRQVSSNAVTYLPCNQKSESRPFIQRRDSPMADDSCSAHSADSLTSQSSVSLLRPAMVPHHLSSSQYASSECKLPLWERRKSRLLSLAEPNEHIRPDASPLSQADVRQRRATSPTTLHVSHLSIQTAMSPAGPRGRTASRTLDVSSLRSALLQRSHSSPTKLSFPASAMPAQSHTTTCTLDEQGTSSTSDSSFRSTPDSVSSPASPASLGPLSDASKLASPKSLPTDNNSNARASWSHSLASPVEGEQTIYEISIAKQVTVTTHVPCVAEMKRPLRARVIELSRSRKGSAISVAQESKD